MSAARRVRPGDCPLIPREFGACLIALCELIDETPSPTRVAALQAAAYAQIGAAVSRSIGRIPEADEVLTREQILAELGGGPWKTNADRWFETRAAKIIRLGDGDCRGPGGEILYSRRKFEAWKEGGTPWHRVVQDYEARQRQ